MEAINKIIKHTLNAKLEESKGNWFEELPRILWSYNKTPRSTTRETPFSLTYGCEAMDLWRLAQDHLGEIIMTLRLMKLIID